MLEWDKIDSLLAGAIQEDLGTVGDITSDSIIPIDKKGKGILCFKEKGLIAGLPIIERLFQMIDENLDIHCNLEDGVHDNKYRETKECYNCGKVLGPKAEDCIYCGVKIPIGNAFNKL